MLGAARDFVRVSLSKTKDRDLTREAFAAEVAAGAFNGSYYRVVEGIHDAAEGKLRLKAVSVSDRLEVGTMTFDIKTGYSTIEWHNSDPDD